MITFKKCMAVAALATLSLGLFAETKEPVSKTNAATAGIFSTDLDDFTNVNSWSNVNPKDFYLYFGMDNGLSNLASSYDIGFAKYFKKIYWGTYFSGNLGTSTKTKTTVGDTTTKTKTTGDSEWVFNNTIGIGNLGLALNLHFFDDGSTKSGEDYSKDTDFDITLKAGLKELAIKKTKIVPYAAINYSIGDGTKVKTGDTVTNNRVSLFSVEAGAALPLKGSKTFEQTLSPSVKFYTQKAVEADHGTFGIQIPVTYTGLVNASDNFAFGFAASLEPSLGFGKGAFSFGLIPSAAFGLTYATKKNIDLNAGIEFALPSYSYSKTTVEGITTTTTKTSSWDGNDASLTFSSGFAIKVSKNFLIDCSYEALLSLFGSDTSSDLTTTGNTNFWNTVNSILIHNIGFDFSIKL